MYNYFKRFILSKLEVIVEKNFLFVLKLFLKIFVFTFKKITSKRKTKISFLNTFDHSGGAAKVTYLIASTLSSKFELTLFVKEKRTNEFWIKEISKKNIGLIHSLLNKIAIKKGWIEFAGFDALNLLKEETFISSKIVHVHNLHGEFLSPLIYSTLFKDKKVIWTLHDESFITGHCSCTLGCEKWKVGCGDCPDLDIYPPVMFDNTKNVLKTKKTIINELQPIVVTPSKWLADRVRVSYPCLKDIHVIHNGIDEFMFKPKNKVESKIELDLPIDKILILFVAEFSTKNPFKGGDIFRKLIAETDFENAIFISVGGKSEVQFSNHITYPYIDNEEELALLYSAADVLLYPTQADNLPLVILESMSCGTPVIASNLGGIPEIILHKQNGFLVSDYKNVEEFKNSLLYFISLSETNRSLFALKARETILTSFTKNKMIEKYLKVYEF